MQDAFDVQLNGHITVGRWGIDREQTFCCRCWDDLTPSRTR